jgi:hypothetical protein
MPNMGQGLDCDLSGRIAKSPSESRSGLLNCHLVIHLLDLKLPHIP